MKEEENRIVKRIQLSTAAIEAQRKVSLEFSRMSDVISSSSVFSDLFYATFRLHQVDRVLTKMLVSVSSQLTTAEANVLWSGFREALIQVRNEAHAKFRAWAKVGIRRNANDSDQPNNRKLGELDRLADLVDTDSLLRLLFDGLRVGGVNTDIALAQHLFELKSLEAAFAHTADLANKVFDYPFVLKQVPKKFFSLLATECEQERLERFYWQKAAEVVKSTDLTVICISEALTLSTVKAFMHYHLGVAHKMLDEVREVKEELQKRRNFLCDPSVPEKFVLKRSTLNMSELPTFPSIMRVCRKHLRPNLPNCTDENQIRKMQNDGHPYRVPGYQYYFLPPPDATQIKDTYAFSLPADASYYFAEPDLRQNQLAITDPIACVFERDGERVHTYAVACLDMKIGKLAELGYEASIVTFIAKCSCLRDLPFEQAVRLGDRVIMAASARFREVGFDEAMVEFLTYYAVALVVLRASGDPNANTEALTIATIEALVKLIQRGKNS